MAPLVLHVFPSFSVGGAQVRFTAIANRFGLAYRHAVVSLDGGMNCCGKLAPDLDVTFPAPEIRKGDTLGNIRRYRRMLRALQPSVLVTSNWGSIEWAMANTPPLVRHVHMEDGFGPEEQQRQLPRRVWLRRFLLRRSMVVLPSRTLWRIATETWRLDQRRLRYIPNGVDLARYAAHVRQEPPPWPATPGGPVIGTVAGLRPEKNVGRLLRAFGLLRAQTPARLVPARLVIVGDGSERARLEQLAATLGVAEAVHFTGQIEQLHRIYPHFDVFALTSDTEQMPLSVLEAMAAGLPVATTDVGDVRAMLADANAPFVTTPDETALAGAFKTLLDRPELRRLLGAANRAKAERMFDQEQMFRDHAALFDGVEDGETAMLR